MKCVKCGMDLEENAKFCGNCGNVVEQPAVETPVEPVVEQAPTVEPVAETVSEPVVNEQPVFSSEVSSSQDERQEIVQEPIPVDTKEFKQQQESGKKSSGAVKYILLVIILLAVAAAGVFAYMKFFANKETYEKSVNTVEKSMMNLAKSEMNSATIEAKLSFKIKNSISLDLGAALEYEKTNNAYKIHARVDKNPMTDQIDVYAEMNEDAITTYIPTALLEMIDSSINLEVDREFIKYQMNLDELDIDLEELQKEIKSENVDIDLSKYLTKDNFKYVGQKDGVKKYTLTVDRKYLDSIKDELVANNIPLDSLDELGNMEFDINFYINKDDMLVGLEMDLTNALKSLSEDIDTALIAINFNKINSTKVEVPASVKNSSFDLNQYMELQQTQDMINSLSSNQTIPTTSKLF